MLTEIHRQARDNPIIALATSVRRGERLAIGRYGASTVTDRFNRDELAAADQILVGRNRTRRANNATQRARRGLSGAYPLIGDKLVALRNDYRRGLLNGSLWSVAEVVRSAANGEIVMRATPDDSAIAITVSTHAKMFEGCAHELLNRSDYAEFDFGYALTVHKAQGSQWGSVAVIDESQCFRENRNRWLYTAITRASERVTIVTDPSIGYGF
jgi:ATP-dependent exoDNAse (exonuclease V) alpha subunit